MGLSTLNIWVRDTRHPLLPYQSSTHNFIALILSCETPYTPLTFGALTNGLFPLTEPGAGGGKVHGQVKVPHGTYLVRAFAPCKNVFTSWAWTQVCCDEEVCVNLITNRFRDCIKETQLVAQLYGWCDEQGIPYRPGSDPVKLSHDLLRKADEVLGALAENLPESDEEYDRRHDEMLKRLMDEAQKQKDA